MARPTRQQRRARRNQGGGEATLAEQSRSARQASSLRSQTQRPQPGRPQPSERRRFFPFRFIGESVGELKKVDWPGRQQLIQGTIVVILACAIVGVYLFACDTVFRRFVQSVLLK